ncbi:MAG TPA: hypothetical protein V6D08_12270, partial [Candidatus Obscuribacterales bacterium]
MDQQKKNSLQSEQALLTHNEGHRWYSWYTSGMTDGNQKSALETSAQLAQRQLQETSADISKLLQTGQVDDNLLAKFNKRTAAVESAFLGEGLTRMRAKLDNPEHVLENLPRNPATISGSLKLPDSNESDGVADYDIRDGKIYRKGSNEPIGSINGPDGSISWTRNGKLENMGMKDLTGAVWHLEFQDENGQQQKLDWITTVDKQGHKGIYSVAELRRQAAAETQYASTFNAQAKSEMSQKAVERSQQAEARFNQRLDDIIKNGIPADANDQGGSQLAKTLSDLIEAPQEKVRAELFRERELPPPKEIRVPDITSDNLEKMNGSMRIGSNHYDIEDGKIYHVYIENGERRRGEECGTMGPGYVATIDGRHVNLAGESQVVLKFTFEGENKEHRILGLGPGRVTSNGTHVQGGLVSADELMRQANEAESQALQGNVEYFKNMPYFLGGTFDQWMGNRGELLSQVQESITNQKRALNREFDQLFNEGLSGNPIDNNQIDHDVRAIQIFMQDMNLSASEVQTLSQEGQQLQKQAADATAMAATTILTAGAGAYFSALASAGRITTLTAYGGEILFGMAAGGTMSATFRHTQGGDLQQFRRNFESGVLEGATMTAGSVGCKFLQRYMQAARAASLGKTLTPAQEALLSSPAGKLVQAMARNEGTQFAANSIFKLGNATFQAAGFQAAAGIREDRLSEEFTWNKIYEAAKWNVIGELAGGLFTAPGKAGQLMDIGEQQFGGWLKVGPSRELKSTLGKWVDNTIESIPNDAINSFTNSAMGALPQAIDMEKERIAKELHISKEAVSEELLERYINYQNVYNFMIQSGAEGALTSPLTSFATAPIRVRSSEIESSLRLTATGYETGPDNQPLIDSTGHTIPSELRQGDTVWSRQSDGTWQIQNPDGTSIKFNGKVATDGETIRVTDVRGTREMHADGSVLVIPHDSQQPRYWLDRDGRVSQVVEPGDGARGTRYNFTYDGDGNVARVTKHDVTYNDDGSIRQVKGTGEEWTSQAGSHDEAGSWTVKKDGKTETVSANDVKRMLLSVTGAGDGPIEVRQNPNGRLRLEPESSGIVPEGPQQVRSAERNLEEARRNLEQGTGTEAEVIRAQQELDATRARVEAEERATRAIVAADEEVTRTRTAAEQEVHTAGMNYEQALAQHRSRLERGEDPDPVQLTRAHNELLVARARAEAEVELARSGAELEKARARLELNPDNIRVQRSVEVANRDYEVARNRADSSLARARADAELAVVQAENKRLLAQQLGTNSESLAKLETDLHAARRKAERPDATEADRRAARKAEIALERARSRAEIESSVLRSQVELRLSDAQRKHLQAHIEANASERLAIARADYELARLRAERQPQNLETQRALARADLFLRIEQAEVESRRTVAAVEADAQQRMARATLESALALSKHQKALADAVARAAHDPADSQAGNALARARDELAAARTDGQKRLAQLGTELWTKVAEARQEARARLQEERRAARRDLEDWQQRYAVGPGGRSTTQTADTTSRVVSWQRPPSAHAKLSAEVSNIDAFRAVSEFDRPAQRWNVERERGLVKSIQDADGILLRSVEREKAGAVLKIVNHVERTEWVLIDGKWQQIKDGQSIRVLNGQVEIDRRGILRIIDNDTRTIRHEYPDGRARVRSMDGGYFKIDANGVVTRIVDRQGRVYRVSLDEHGNPKRIDITGGHRYVRRTVGGEQRWFAFTREPGSGATRIHQLQSLSINRDSGAITLKDGKGDVWVRGLDGRLVPAKTAAEAFMRLGEAAVRAEQALKDRARVMMREEHAKALSECLNMFRQSVQRLRVPDQALYERLEAKLVDALDRFAEMMPYFQSTDDVDLIVVKNVLQDAFNDAERTIARSGKSEHGAITSKDDRTAHRQEIERPSFAVPPEEAHIEPPSPPRTPLEEQRARLGDLLQSLSMDGIEYSRLRKNLDTFEQRPLLSNEEKTKTYEQIRRFLEASSGQLDQRTRLYAVHELLKNIADPLGITQGFHNTCNVTTQEVRLCTFEPSEYVRLVADILTTGEHTTRNGTTVRVPLEQHRKDTEALKHWATALNRFLAPLGPAGLVATHQAYEQLPLLVDPDRNWASQIFQVAAVNLCWQQKTSVVQQDGSTVHCNAGDIVYRQVPRDDLQRIVVRQSAGTEVEMVDARDTGERLVLRSPDGTQIVLSSAPDLTVSDMEFIYRSITGKDDPEGVLVHPYFTGGVDQPGRTFRTPEELLQLLNARMETCQREGKPFCITTGVHTFSEPFFTDSRGGEAGGSGGPHVVNIVGLRTETMPDGRQETFVEIDNQWRRQDDHRGSRAIPLREFFWATHDPSEPSLIKNIEAYVSAHPTDFLARLELARHKFRRFQEIASALNDDPSLTNPRTVALATDPDNRSTTLSYAQLDAALADLVASYRQHWLETYPGGGLPPEFATFIERANQVWEWAAKVRLELQSGNAVGSQPGGDPMQALNALHMLNQANRQFQADPGARRGKSLKEVLAEIEEDKGKASQQQEQDRQTAGERSRQTGDRTVQRAARTESEAFERHLNEALEKIGEPPPDLPQQAPAGSSGDRVEPVSGIGKVGDEGQPSGSRGTEVERVQPPGLQSAQAKARFDEAERLRSTRYGPDTGKPKVGTAAYRASKSPEARLSRSAAAGPQAGSPEPADVRLGRLDRIDDREVDYQQIWNPPKHGELSPEVRRIVEEYARRSSLYSRETMSEAVTGLSAMITKWRPVEGRVAEATFNERRSEYIDRVARDLRTKVNFDPPHRLMEDADAVYEQLQGDPEKLAIAQRYFEARKSFVAHAELLRTLTEERRWRLEQFLNHFAANRDLKIAPVRIEAVDDAELAGQAARYANGVLQIRKSALFGERDPAKFIGEVYHEYTHHEQASLMVRGLAHRLHREGGEVSPQQIAELYGKLTDDKLPLALIEQVLALGGFEDLPAEIVARVNDLLHAHRNNYPAGDALRLLEEQYRVTVAEFNELTNLGSPSEFFQRLSRDRAFRENLFGNAELPPEVSSKLNQWQLLRETGSNTAEINKAMADSRDMINAYVVHGLLKRLDADSAGELSRKLFGAAPPPEPVANMLERWRQIAEQGRPAHEFHGAFSTVGRVIEQSMTDWLLSINTRRHDQWERYMGFHEIEARTTGELAEHLYRANLAISQAGSTQGAVTAPRVGNVGAGTSTAHKAETQQVREPGRAADAVTYLRQKLVDVQTTTIARDDSADQQLRKLHDRVQLLAEINVELWPGSSDPSARSQEEIRTIAANFDAHLAKLDELYASLSASQLKDRTAGKRVDPRLSDLCRRIETLKIEVADRRLQQLEATRVTPADTLDQRIQKATARMELLSETLSALGRIEKAPVPSKRWAEKLLKLDETVDSYLAALSTDLDALQKMVTQGRDANREVDPSLVQLADKLSYFLSGVIESRLQSRYGWDKTSVGSYDQSEYSMQSGFGAQRRTFKAIAELLNEGLFNYDELNRALSRKGVAEERADDFIGLGIREKTAADQVGADYLLANPITGEFYPLDLTVRAELSASALIDTLDTNPHLWWSPDKRVPSDRQRWLLCTTDDEAWADAIRRLLKDDNVPLHKWEELERRYGDRVYVELKLQLARVLGEIIAAPSPLHLIRTPLPCNDPALDPTRQLYEIWRFKRSLERAGMHDWAGALNGALGYVIKSHNLGLDWKDDVFSRGNVATLPVPVLQIQAAASARESRQQQAAAPKVAGAPYHPKHVSSRDAGTGREAQEATAPRQRDHGEDDDDRQPPGLRHDAPYRPGWHLEQQRTGDLAGRLREKVHAGERVSRHDRPAGS